MVHCRSQIVARLFQRRLIAFTVLVPVRLLKPRFCPVPDVTLSCHRVRQ